MGVALADFLRKLHGLSESDNTEEPIVHSDLKPDHVLVLARRQHPRARSRHRQDAARQPRADGELLGERALRLAGATRGRQRPARRRPLGGRRDAVRDGLPGASLPGLHGRRQQCGARARDPPLRTARRHPSRLRRAPGRDHPQDARAAAVPSVSDRRRSRRGPDAVSRRRRSACRRGERARQHRHAGHSRADGAPVPAARYRADRSAAAGAAAGCRGAGTGQSVRPGAGSASRCPARRRRCARSPPSS